jgi:hypothetical protein
MTEGKGPITLITDLSQKRNRWKALAFAWRSAAVSAIKGCTVCGSPALWKNPAGDTHWCLRHHEDASADERESALKLPWFQGLARALELEEELAEDL